MWRWRPRHCTDSTLVALLDGELDPNERVTARHHLAGCRACFTQLQQHEAAANAVIDLLAVDWPAAQPVPAIRRHLSGGVASAGILVASVGAIVAAGIVARRRRHHSIAVLGDGRS